MSEPLLSVAPESPAAALPTSGSTQSYGLKQQILSPLETLAQSISTIAPTASPTMTIPLVFALAGNGTWLVYLLASTAILLVGLCVSRFARYSASPGSLYAYAASTLRPALGSVTAWALLLAYVATAISVTGGFINYANVLSQSATGTQLPSELLVAIAVGVSTWIAYRDVKISARLMLWIEITSVSLIVIIALLLLRQNGLHVDAAQLRLRAVRSTGVRLGLVLALFSFVGFESATTLGGEAREPLRTIPRAVIQSALLVGALFIVCAYTEVLGFRKAGLDFGQSSAPFHVLARVAGVPPFGPLIDAGALISMFACTLACITAAARVLLLMSHHGITHKRLTQTHQRNATPGRAVMVVGALTYVPTAVMAARGVSGADIYGWMGSLATYGFITVYALIALALPVFLKRKGHLSAGAVLLSIAATLAMLLALVGTIYPVPLTPYNWLPYLYLAYLLAGLIWYLARRSRSGAAFDRV